MPISFRVPWHNSSWFPAWAVASGLLAVCPPWLQPCSALIHYPACCQNGFAKRKSAPSCLNSSMNSTGLRIKPKLLQISCLWPAAVSSTALSPATALPSQHRLSASDRGVILGLVVMWCVEIIEGSFWWGWRCVLVMEESVWWGWEYVLIMEELVWWGWGVLSGI